jgi:YfiR/HmsC-like
VRRVSKLLATAALGAFVWTLSMTPARAEEGYSQDAVIAAYLYRFTSYIDWPQQATIGHPFLIDVYGDPGVAQALRRLLAGHPIHNESAVVNEVRTVRDLGDPQILYVGAGHAGFLRSVPSDESRHVLVVTDESHGLDVGSALNFVTVDKRVRFEVSLTAADRAGIKISSDLLSVAIRVHGGRRQSGGLCIPFPLPQDNDPPCVIREARVSPPQTRRRTSA